MQTVPCNPCCSTPQTVQVPGTTGANGISAFTTVTDNFVIPAADGVSTVVVTVANNQWMAAGEYLYIPIVPNTPNFFQISSVSNDGVSVTLTYPNISINSNTGGTIIATAPVTPAGPPFTGTLPIANGGTGASTKATAQAALGLGQSSSTSFQNALAQAISFSGAFAQAGTVGVTLSQAGIYLVSGFVRFSFAGVTVNSALNFRLYDTTGGFAVANDTAPLNITTQTLPQIQYGLGPTIYSVGGGGAVIQPQANISAGSLGAGTLDVQAACVSATPLALT